jgi:hypothetical protein
VAPVFDVPRLQALLDEWEGWWSHLDLPINEVLRPGATDEHIDTVASRLPFELPEEVRTWFRWHDGTMAEHADQFENQVAPIWNLISLEQAAAFYRHGQDNLTWAYQWPPHYFPLLHSDRLLVVDCSGALKDPAPIDVIDPEFERPADPPEPILPSVTALVETFVTLVRRSAISYQRHRKLVWFANDQPPQGLWPLGL